MGISAGGREEILFFISDRTPFCLILSSLILFFLYMYHLIGKQLIRVEKVFLFSFLFSPYRIKVEKKEDPL